MVDVGPEQLFRIIRKEHPTSLDFTSKAALGIPCPDPDPNIRRLWAGLSFFATEAQARRAARRYQRLGSAIAKVRVAEVAGVRIERTLGAGHYTVWGHPDDLLSAVVSVTPARRLY
jgi:hypothetical protein